MLMTVHGAMHRNEVIGFLSGFRTRTKGPATKKDVFIIFFLTHVIRLSLVIMITKMLTTQKNVEMDPESATA